MAAAKSLATLLRQTHIEDDQEILDAAERALKSSKDDLETQHVRIVALLKLDRFEDAVKAFQAGGEPIQKKAQLEHAYALYKTGNPSSAAKVARQQSQRAFQHVEAQASYRAEDFARAAELYTSLRAAASDDAAIDLSVNSSAVDAQLEWSGQGHLVQKRRLGREELDTYETAFNAACGCIARGELPQADILLKRARDICSKLEDLTETERRSELVPITTQQIYVLSLLEKKDEARKLAETIEPSEAAHRDTRYISQVNKFLASDTSENPFVVERLISQDVATLKPDYPFKFQTQLLQANKYAVALQSSKQEGVIRTTEKALAKVSSPSVDEDVIRLATYNAAAHVQGHSGKQALKILLPLLEKRPLDAGLALTIAQIYVDNKDTGSAISLVERLLLKLEKSEDADQANLRYAPRLVTAMVSLYRSAGRETDISNELYKAATHIRRNASSDTRTSGERELLNAAGAALLASRVPEHQQYAGEIFKELYLQDPHDRKAAAGLLAFSPEEVTKGPIKFESIDRLVNGVDVDQLENAGIYRSASAVTATRKRPAEESAPVKTKKARKSRLPKDYDPNKKPDPERWLPLRDRSTYRPRGKKGKAKQAQFSQGAAPVADSETSRPDTPGAEVLKAKQGGGGGAAPKKKKAKSKR